MIAACREKMIASEGELALGLMALRAGDDSPRAEAAFLVVAETVLLHRSWILAHKKG